MPLGHWLPVLLPIVDLRLVADEVPLQGIVPRDEEAAGGVTNLLLEHSSKVKGYSRQPTISWRLPFRQKETHYFALFFSHFYLELLRPITCSLCFSSFFRLLCLFYCIPSVSVTKLKDPDPWARAERTS